MESIAYGWQDEGHRRYPRPRRLQVAADAGGSNSCRSRVWKTQLQEKLCNREGLEVTVCPYPPGCSKWNPIEHRLFSHITLNWAGKVLRSFQTLIGHIRGTGTRTGLIVSAELDRGGNETGERVSDEQMCRLHLRPHDVCPQWKYTLWPRRLCSADGFLAYKRRTDHKVKPIRNKG